MSAELRCSGCGTLGRAPAVVFDKANPPPGVPLKPVSGWGDREAMLCPKCRLGLRRNRGRARYSKPRLSDGRLTT